MTGVVIRCPNCGTTQAELGECDACHEGETRYFCPNHTPGLWLDGPACSQCGARVGAPPTAGRGAPAATGRKAPRATASPPPPARTEAPARPTERPTARPTRPTRPPEAELLEMLRRSGIGVRRPADPVGVDGPTAPEEGSAPHEPTGAALLFGCLRRIVIAGVLLFLLALLAFYFLFRVGGPMNGVLEPATGTSLAASQLTSPRASCSMDDAQWAEGPASVQRLRRISAAEV